MTSVILKPLTFTISRTSTGPNGTLGVFTAQVGDAMVYKCYTLEDPVREPGAAKVWGDTAIPAGKYPVAIRFSNRFQKELPGVQNVPGFEGILLHGGNDKLDTHGCPLLGTQLQALQPKPRIGLCAPAVSMVVGLLKKHGPATLTVKDPA
jgi:hypothetical protein